MFADIVIIGGGIVGTSIAYHLALLKAGKIVLLEREELLGTGSTGRCAGGFRHQFSSEINIKLSLESIRMILRFADELEFPIDVHQDGYLFLLTKQAGVEAFRRSVQLQNRLGAQSQMLLPAEIGHMAPHISLDGVLAGAYCAHDGIGDPSGMTQGYAAAARRLGVDIRTGTPATGIKVAHDKIEGVFSGADFIPCNVLINAAGPHAANIASLAGIDLPVVPERRHVYTTAPFAQVPSSFMMVIDYETTFYFHRESSGILMGMADPDESSSFNLAVNPDFLEKLLEVALIRYPALANTSVQNAWAGLYAISPDGNPIIGRVAHVEGFILANGFSGHGFQHAPVIGKLLAEEMVNGEARTLDITPLRFERFLDGKTTSEKNVI